MTQAANATAQMECDSTRGCAARRPQTTKVLGENNHLADFVGLAAIHPLHIWLVKLFFFEIPHTAVTRIRPLRCKTWMSAANLFEVELANKTSSWQLSRKKLCHATSRHL